jgi:hypothetical protein
MKRKLSIVAVGVLLLSATAGAGRDFTFDKTVDFDAAGIARIDIDMPAGDIKISRSQTDRIEVVFKNEIFAGNKSEAEEFNEECEYKAEASGDMIKITVDLPGHPGNSKGLLHRLLTGDWEDNVHFYLWVSVPDGKVIELNSSSADLEVSQLKLDLNVRGSSSDITLKGTEGNVTCDLSSGDADVFDHKGQINIDGRSSDIQVDGLDGDISMRTSSGDGRIFDATGSVEAYSSSGDWRINNVGKDLDVRTSSGDIYVDGVAGSVRAEASSGDIRLNALSAKQGDFDVESVSGDVSVEINPRFGGRLSLRTSSGSINCAVSADIETLSDSRLVGNVGEGSGRLIVSTSSGDIRVTGY